MRRPGFLAGYESMTSMASRRAARSYSGFGFFGKGFFIPSPPGAPVGVTGTKLLTTAVNTKTGKFYMQDNRCEEGMKMTKYDNPCDGPDCDPGERDIGEECDDDPEYRELSPPPSEGFPDCKAWKNAGYPSADCNKQTCPSCFAPKQQQQQQSKNSKASQPSPEQPQNLTGPTPEEEAEMRRLETEQMMLMQAPVGIPAMSQTYTGGGGGGMPMMSAKPTLSQEEVRQQQLEQLVSEHETEGALHRSMSPVATAPPPRSVQVDDNDDDDDSEVVSRPSPGLFSWLKQSLFGASGAGFGTYGETSSLKKYIIPAIALIIVYKMVKK